MSGLPIPAAAVALDISPGTLRRWIENGAPVARRGRRGRGKSTLVSPAAITAWRRSEGGEDALLAFAGQVPEIMADAASESFVLIDGPFKRQAAGVLAASWYMATCAVLDAMRATCPAIPELSDIPESIERLRLIARQ